MTLYLSYPNGQDAQAASASDWENVLGRGKFSQDVTTYLWPVLVNPNDGTAIGVIDDDALPYVAIPVGGFLSSFNQVVVDTLAAIAAAVGAP